jgi:hypothetical protein
MNINVKFGKEDNIEQLQMFKPSVKLHKLLGKNWLMNFVVKVGFK